MKITIKILCFSVLMTFSLTTFAQKISDKQTEKLRIEYEEKFERGEVGGKKIESKIEYNKRGKETKEYKYKDGQLEEYTVYTYLGNKKSEEHTYGADDKLISRAEYEYNANGDRIKKTTYNTSGKVIKINTYSYEYYENENE
ncbi:MAG: hypothetical protein LBR55_00430 [Bacteroidales bacterium]|jgi:hypothetical protein|nr:hypothetical protein [Bacteroidales bacterium]